jgi:hypothetical protein
MAGASALKSETDNTTLNYRVRTEYGIAVGPAVVELKPL